MNPIISTAISIFVLACILLDLIANIALGNRLKTFMTRLKALEDIAKGGSGGDFSSFGYPVNFLMKGTGPMPPKVKKAMDGFEDAPYPEKIAKLMEIAKQGGIVKITLSPEKQGSKRGIGFEAMVMATKDGSPIDPKDPVPDIDFIKKVMDMRDKPNREKNGDSSEEDDDEKPKWEF